MVLTLAYNAQLAARDATGLGVDRHQPQIPAAIPPSAEPRRTLGDFNRLDLFLY